MGIEVAIAENTSAIKELIGVWAKLLAQGKSINADVAAGKVTNVTAGTATIPVAHAKVEAPKPAPTHTAPVTDTPAPTPEAAPTEAATEYPSEVTYEVVVKAINAAVDGGRRAKVMAALATFGAKKGPDLKPEQYAQFLKEIA